MPKFYSATKFKSLNVKRGIAVFMTVLFISLAQAAAPVITFFSPAAAATGATILIRGTHFSGATAVSFGGVAASSFTVQSSTVILAVVGTGATGSVKVVTPGGQDTAAGFTYLVPLNFVVITSFTPDSAATGTTVSISGRYFTGATSVGFGGVQAQSFTVLSDTAISAVVGTGASGAVSVAGIYGSDSLAGFTYISPASDAVLKAAAVQTLAVYPNPASGDLWVTPPNTLAPSQFILVDMMGKTQKIVPVSRNVPQVRIPLTGVGEGLYKLIWSNGTTQVAKTILIKR